MKKNRLLSILLLTAVFAAPSFTSAQSVERHMNGTLINHEGTIFLIRDNKRFGFRSAGEFLSNGYTFDMAVPANVADMGLPYNLDLKARTGTLVLDFADKQTIYLIYDNQARPITNYGMLYFFNFAERPPVSIDLSRYPKGAVAGFDLLFQPRPAGTLINNKGTVYLITDKGRAGFPTQAIFRSYGYEFNMAMQANDQDMLLPEAPAVKYRDGTLVNDNGTIFLVSEGTKYGFKTWTGFISRGYKLSPVIPGSTADYPEGAAFE
jgi:hypothetical protein